MYVTHKISAQRERDVFVGYRPVIARVHIHSHDLRESPSGHENGEQKYGRHRVNGWVASAKQIHITTIAWCATSCVLYAYDILS